MLGAVGEDDHAGQRSPGRGPQRVVEGGADRRLVARRSPLPGAEGKRVFCRPCHGAGLPIEGPQADVDISLGHEFGRGRAGGSQRRGHLLETRPSRGPVDDGHALGGIGDHE